MKQVLMEYWVMDIEKVNEINFLNEEVEKCASRWSQSVVNVRSLSYLKEDTFEYCLWGINRLFVQFFIQKWWCVVSLS